jgi:hypothetical protein
VGKRGGLSAEPSEQTSPRQSLRAELSAKLLLIFLLTGLPIGLATSPRTFDDGDVSWHVAAGRWMLARHAIPTTDPFSFTAYGHPWIAMEWLADVIYAAAYAVAGYAGLGIIVAVALVALHAIIFVHLRRDVGPLGIAAAIVSVDIVCSHFILARPHVLVWPILAAWTVLLLRSLETGRVPPWWSLLLLVAWTNIHASFPLALVIAGGIALDALIEAKWKNWRPWAIFLALSVAALMLNANGIRGLTRPFHIEGLAMLPSILEWQASTPSLTPEFYGVLLFGLGALLVRGVKVPPGRLLLLLLLIGMAFSQVRHQSWLIIVAALVLPGLFRSGGSMTERVAPFLLAALPLLFFRVLFPLGPSEGPANPRHLLAAVPAPLRNEPVLNGYTFGGPLILAGMRPYIDGRAEMYGDEFFADYVKISDGDMTRFDRALNRYDIRWTMLPNDDGALIKQLDSSASWRRLYSDRVGVIHVRVK